MQNELNNYIYNEIKVDHPELANLLAAEDERQQQVIELIASENFPSLAVRLACASSAMAKYAEGYPAIRHDDNGSHGRYYGGCYAIDKIEEYCCDAWRRAFNTDYHVNVQPHSGSHANMAAYMSVLNLGDRILSMDMSAGHLTHSSPASFVTKLYDVKTYGLNDNGFIDYDKVRKIANKVKPKLILAGASAYSREINFKAFREICDEVGAIFMVDMAHIAGLIAAGDHMSPFGLADIITSTTQKTLRGPRGGLIFCKSEFAKAVDSAVFPRTSGGPAENIIAAKAVAADEVCTEEFHNYIHRVVENTKAMADTFKSLGFHVVSGGTDNHLFLIDISKTHKNITGKMVQDTLEKNGYTVNKNMCPGDHRKPSETSGIRIGLAAMTTKGWTTKDAINHAKIIAEIINGIKVEEMCPGDHRKPSETSGIRIGVSSIITNGTTNAINHAKIIADIINGNKVVKSMTNKVKESCKGCHYLHKNICIYEDGLCSHTYSLTTCNTDSRIICTPIPESSTDKNIIIINTKIN